MVDGQRVKRIAVPPAAVMAKFQPYVGHDVEKVRVAPPVPEDFVEHGALAPVWDDADIQAQLAELKAIGVDLAAVGLVPDAAYTKAAEAPFNIPPSSSLGDS